ncbi:MAG: hypothetical protein ACKOBT_07520, partial [Actinomycetota bacterium]
GAFFTGAFFGGTATTGTFFAAIVAPGTVFAGAFLAGAFFAGAFLAGVFFAGAFLAADVETFLAAACAMVMTLLIRFRAMLPPSIHDRDRTSAGHVTLCAHR